MVHVFCSLLSRRRGGRAYRRQVTEIYWNALGNVYLGTSSSKLLIALIFQTDEPYHEPPKRLLQAMEEKGLDLSTFHTVKIGESVIV